MKNNEVSINPIGLAQDFSELFGEINNSDSSSDNWFQQYNVNPKLEGLTLHVFDDFTSGVFLLSEFYRTQSSTKNKTILLSNDEFIEKYKNPLFYEIKKSSIYRGEDNEMSLFFSKMLEENRVTALYILNELFIKNMHDDAFCVKILSLCNDYSYDDLDPTAQTLAALSIHHKSDRVKSAAMNLFSHWGSYTAYKLLVSIDCPKEPWIQVKYQTIKKTLERRWCMQEK